MLTVLAFVKSRLGEWAIILVLVAGIGWYGYDKVVDHAKATQMAADQKVIDKSNADRDAAIATKNQYVAQYNKFVSDTNKAVAQQKVDQDKINADTATKLAAAEKRAAQVRTVIKQVDHYVTTTADAHCTIPVGFVQLFNGTLEANASASFPTISSGSGGLADAPSGIALSTVASIIGANNAEAVQRGVIIQQWQDWYKSSRDAFTKAQQAQADSIPTAN